MLLLWSKCLIHCFNGKLLWGRNLHFDRLMWSNHAVNKNPNTEICMWFKDFFFCHFVSGKKPKNKTKTCCWKSPRLDLHEQYCTLSSVMVAEVLNSARKPKLSASLKTTKYMWETMLCLSFRWTYPLKRLLSDCYQYSICVSLHQSQHKHGLVRACRDFQDAFLKLYKQLGGKLFSLMCLLYVEWRSSMMKGPSLKRIRMRVICLDC